MKRIWWILVISVSFGLAVALVAWFGWVYHAWITDQRTQAYQPGVSFAAPYAQELGVDPHQTYLALLNDLKVRRFRLMSYWDVIEPQPGKYDFSELDWEMAEARKTNAKVSLAIGLRQPRWPECHQPGWVAQLSPQDQKTRLEAFMSAVVQRYRNDPALDSYQLENEALNTVFGTCKNFDRNRLVEEFNLVKQLDPNHPIMVSVSNEYGLPVGQPRGDIVGFSVYRRVYDATITKHYVTYPFPPFWFGMKAALIQKLLHRPSAIHELQTEPWGPKPTVQMTIPEQDQSMTASRLLSTVKYAQETGIRQYYLWGGEWWYYRLVKLHDPSVWNAAKLVYQQTP